MPHCCWKNWAEKRNISMYFSITGGAWISSKGWGFPEDGSLPVFDSETPVKVPPDVFCHETVKKYGRFDDYTRLGFACAGLALKNSGFCYDGIKKDIGIAVATRYGCLSNDFDYYKTTLEDDGALSSPNLFSYTLPGIVLGETALYFKLAGPTLCTGSENESRGMDALRSACSILAAGVAKTMLAGWLDCSDSVVPGEKWDKGAVFAVISSASECTGSFMRIRYESGMLFSGNGDTRLKSIDDIFYR